MLDRECAGHVGVYVLSVTADRAVEIKAEGPKQPLKVAKIDWREVDARSWR
jgi:hypothetical protein